MLSAFDRNLLAFTVGALTSCAREGQPIPTADAGSSSPQQASSHVAGEPFSTSTSRQPEKVASSFIQLIAHPQEFANSKVYLHGFLRLTNVDTIHGGGDGYLYMRDGDSESLRIKLGPCRSGDIDAGSNARFVTIHDALVHVGYRGGSVAVHGFFEPPNRYGELVGDFGSICGITRILPNTGSERDGGALGQPRRAN